MEEHRPLVVQLAMKSALSMPEIDKHDNTEDVKVGPGCEFTRSRESKLGYIRKKGKNDKVYIDAIHPFDTDIFNSLTGMRATEFDALYRQVAALIDCPIDSKFRTPEKEMMLLTPQEKAILPHTMTFPL